MTRQTNVASGTTQQLTAMFVEGCNIMFSRMLTKRLDAGPLLQDPYDTDNLLRTSHHVTTTSLHNFLQENSNNSHDIK
jgi:hypothetical protein